MAIAGSLANTSSISGSGTLAFNRSTDLTVSQSISGSLVLKKDGPNALTLSGPNTYSGPTNVNSGALVVNGSLNAASAVSVSNGAVLGGTGTVGNVNLVSGSSVHPGALINGSIGTLTVKNLAVAGGELVSDLASPSVGDLLVATGNVSFNAGSTTTFSPIFTGLPSAGIYPLITVTSPGTLSVGSGATLTVNPPSADSRFTFGLTTTQGTGGSVKLSVAGNAFNLTWTGTQSNDWDLKSHTNWKTSSLSNQQYFEFDNVTFDDSVVDPSKHTINIVPTNQSNTFSPASTTVNANSDYTFNGGGIGGFGGLTKLGTGKLTINTTNSYTGATWLQNGTTVLGRISALPTTTNLTLGSGSNSATLDLNGNSITVASLATSGTGTANTIGSSSSFSLLTVSSGTNTFGGNIVDAIGAGAGQLAIAVPTGSLTLTGANNYTGQTTLGNGVTLQVGNGGATGSLGATPLSFGDANSTLIFNRSGATRFDGTLSGAGTLQQIGTGTTTLTGSNSNSGVTTIGAGTLQLGDATVNGGTTGSLGVGSITDNGTLIFNRNDGDATTPIMFANVISGTGGIQHNGTGAVRLTGLNTFTGNVVVNAGTLIVTTTQQDSGRYRRTRQHASCWSYYYRQ